MLRPTRQARFLTYTVFFLATLAALGIIALLQSKVILFDTALVRTPQTADVSPFPVSVNSQTREIVENPSLDSFYEATFTQHNQPTQTWFNQFAALLTSQQWYQNLASPVGRIIVIWPGERKEEVVQHIGDILLWDQAQRTEFQQLVDSQTPVLSDGKYFPGQYVTHRSATPLDIASLITTEFTTEVTQRYTPSVAQQVPLADALIIASLLEREASDFVNMREVAGVIWNRLFIDMPLQLDATLQYVKGSNPYEPRWWPAVRPQDKYLDSAFNSYQNKGLPPSPIANPSAEAILAALNPIQTDCLYYFHGPDASYYCSVDYGDHVTKLKQVYGRGK